MIPITILWYTLSGQIFQGQTDNIDASHRRYAMSNLVERGEALGVNRQLLALLEVCAVSNFAFA
jgi:hypothetical protein